jgi:hypothetical protein
VALRWGKYVFLTEERLDKAEEFFDHHGGKIIVVARFIEGLRQANGIIAGITGMHWRRFAIFNAIGAALWVGTWVSLGYLAGNHIDTIYRYITNYSLYVAIALVVIIAALIARHLVRRRRAGQAPAGQTPADEAGEAGTSGPETPGAGPVDPGTVDAETPDAGTPDAEIPGAGTPDARSSGSGPLRASGQGGAESAEPDSAGGDVSAQAGDGARTQSS